MKDHLPATKATDEEITRRARAILAGNINLLDPDLVREARHILTRGESSQEPTPSPATAPATAPAKR